MRWPIVQHRVNHSYIYYFDYIVDSKVNETQRKTDGATTKTRVNNKMRVNDCDALEVEDWKFSNNSLGLTAQLFMNAIAQPLLLTLQFHEGRGPANRDQAED